MEAAVLLGLIGIGYLNNNRNENIEVNVNKEINIPSGDNVYNSGYYDETNKVIKSLAENNFEEANNTIQKLLIIMDYINHYNRFQKIKRRLKVSQILNIHIVQLVVDLLKNLIF